MSDIHALVGAYAIDALEPSERTSFEEHLATCADCRAEVQSLREAAALLAETSAVEPPPALRERLLDDIKTVRPLPPLVQHDQPAVRAESSSGAPPVASSVAEPVSLDAARRRRFRPALAAAAAVAAAVAAVIVGGVVVTQPWDNNQSTEQQLTAADRVLGDPGAQHVTQEFPDGATATVVRSKEEGKAVLVTAKMPPPPEGKVYELWLRTPKGVMMPAGLMPVKADQTVLLKGEATDATAVGITVEPVGGSDKPTSAPIAMFDFEAA